VRNPSFAFGTVYTLTEGEPLCGVQGEPRAWKWRKLIQGFGLQKLNMLELGIDEMGPWEKGMGVAWL